MELIKVGLRVLDLFCGINTRLSENVTIMVHLKKKIVLLIIASDLISGLNSLCLLHKDDF